jgi:hypothetical protein
MVWEKVKDGYYEGTTTTKADGLRVCIANHGQSYWYLHYWNTIYHKNYVKGRKEKVDSLVTSLSKVLKDTTWYTPPMQPSWKKDEDAIFIAGNGKIIKLTYDPYYESISKLILNFSFKDSTSEVISGLATTKADSNRMYAATKNGKFYYSLDLGKSWTATSYKGNVPYIKNRPWWGPYGYAIKTAPDNADFVCWAGEGDETSAFLISTDGGKNFKAATNGLPPHTNINDFSIIQGGKYIISNNLDIYSTEDNKWYDMKEKGFPYDIDVRAVEYIQKEKTIRFFTYGLGVVDFIITN